MNAQAILFAFVDAADSVRLCLTLVHSLWQVALAAAVARAIGRLWRRRSVERSYAVHVAALVAALAAVPATYALVDGSLPSGTELVGSPDCLPIGVPQAPEVSPIPLAAAASQVDKQPGLPRVAAQVEEQPGLPNTAAPQPLSLWWKAAPWFAGVYALGVLVMLARLVRGTWLAQRLAARAQRFGDGALVERLNAIARAWSMRVVPALARTEEIVVPKLVGLMRPTILLPVSAISGLSADELELILAHELAHVRRHDMWVHLVQRAAEVVLFFNPALWYLSRRISTLREYCCDELTCRSAPGTDAERRTCYATALVRIVELARPTAGASTDLATLAATNRSPSDLRRRVAQLFGEPLDEPVRLSRGGVMTLAVLAAVLFTASTAWRSAAESTPPSATATDEDSEEPKQVDQQPKLAVDVTILGVNGKPIDQYSAVTVWEQIDAASATMSRDRLWREPWNDAIWRRVLSSSSGEIGPDRNGKDRFLSRSALRPGVYRVTAFVGSHKGKMLGMAVSEPIRLDRSQETTPVKIAVQDGPPVTFTVVDAGTGEPIDFPRPRIRLTRPDGLDVEWNALNPSLFPGDDGKYRIEHLAPGTCRLDVSVRTDAYGYPDYRMAKPIDVEIRNDRPNDFVVKLTAQPIDEAEAEKRWPWAVEDTVTDAGGQPLEGVAIRAACGMGTLGNTMPVFSDAHGHYRLRFGPGLMVLNEKTGKWGAGVQCAVISARKAGWAENNLYRQGDLLMADEMPEARSQWDRSKIILPGEPYGVDFTMVPAAGIDGQLLDEHGEPLADEEIILDGDVLPPASSIVGGAATDAEGRFHFDRVAPGFSWWLEVGGEKDGARSRTQPFTLQSRQYHAILRVTSQEGTGRMLRIASIKDSEGRDAEGILGDDPRARPFVDEKTAAKAREILDRVAAVNRYWFGGPADDVKSFSYTFHLAGEEPREISYQDYLDAEGWHREWYPKGISYTGAARVLTSLRSRAKFRDVEIGDQQISIYFVLDGLPSTVAAGNGIAQTWRGFYSLGMKEGRIVLDAKRLTPISIQYGDHHERYDNYVAVEPGCCVPLSIQLGQRGSEFRWAFRVWQPGLWLFDKSADDADEPIAWTTDVTVNGQAAKATTVDVSAGSRDSSAIGTPQAREAAATHPAAGVDQVDEQPGLSAPAENAARPNDDSHDVIVDVFVVDPDGRPVADAEVLACNEAVFSSRTYRTDASGRVSIPWERSMLHGVFRLMARHGEAIGWHGTPPGPDIAEEAVKKTIRITLYARSQTIEGVCVDVRGQPLGDVRVHVSAIYNHANGNLSLDGPWDDLLGTVVSDAEGHYSLKVPEFQLCAELAEHPKFVAIERNRSNGWPHIKQERFFLTEPAGTIHGRVVEAATGKTMQGAVIVAQAIVQDSGRRSVSTGVSDNDGEYTFRSLNPGFWNVFVELPSKPTWTAAAVDNLDVKPGETARADFRMEPGRLLSGKVIDAASGRPLPGVNVGYYGSARPSSGAACMMVESDAAGQFQFHVPPGETRVYVAEPQDGEQASRTFIVERDQDPAPLVLKTKIASPNSFGIAAADERGEHDSNETEFTVRGTLRTADGRAVPIAWIQVWVPSRARFGQKEYVESRQFLARGGEFSNFLGNRFFDKDGKRQTELEEQYYREKIGKTWYLVVDAPGYARPEPIAFTFAKEIEPIAVVLQRPTLVPVRGRVLDQRGQPVAGANVSVSLSTVGEAVEEPWGPEYLTDEEGRFEVKHVHIGNRFAVRVTKDNYRPAESPRIPLKNANPIDLGELRLEASSPDSPAIAVPQPREAVATPPDAGAAQVGEKSELPDWVYARPVAPDAMTGKVLMSDGTAANGASVAVCTRTREVTVQGGKLRCDGKLVETASDGTFRVAGAVEPWVLVVAHDGGYAEATAAEFPKSSTMRLKPWGRIEGQFVLGGKPIAGQDISVGAGRGDVDVVLHYGARATTDAEGKFVVERVPPVELWVQPVFERDGTDFGVGLSGYMSIAPGETTHVTIPRPGRAVIGRIALPPDSKQRLADFSVEAEIFLEPPPFSGHRDWIQKSRAAYGDLMKSELGQMYRRDKIDIAADGTFRVEGLAEANYMLRVRARRKAVSPSTDRSQTSAYAASDMQVPPLSDSKEPVDVGEVVLRFEL